MTRAKPRGGAEIKAALMAAANELFGQKGPDTVSVRDVAALADLNPALIHRYFGTKEQLIRQALSDHAATFRRAAMESPDARSAAGTMFEVMAGNPAFLRIYAHLVLEGHSPEEYIVKSGGVAKLAELLKPVHESGASLEAALIASQVMGWLLFEPFILFAANYNGDPAEARAEACRRIVDAIPSRRKRKRKTRVRDSAVTVDDAAQ